MSTFIRLGYLALGGVGVAAVGSFWVACSPGAATVDEGSLIDHGRYLIRTAGCNDCHTAGYIMRDGDIPESDWLMGDTLGWKGPWGTTYGTNLRLYMANFSEEDWMEVARTMRPRPPMPWFNVHAMNDIDLRAIYYYIRTLEPLGEPAPPALAPGVEPSGPFVLFPDPPPENGP